MIQALGSGIDIFLCPGEWYFGDADTRIRTTLGSCVAMTLWHPRLRIGGMCHFMLPGKAKGQSRGEPTGRYADDAVELLLTEVHRHKAPLADYQVKLFGGASMFKSGRQDAADSPVPEKNIRAARALVLQHGLRVTAQSLGGNCYRQLVFNLADGDVWMRLGADYHADAHVVGSA